MSAVVSLIFAVVGVFAILGGHQVGIGPIGVSLAIIGFGFIVACFWLIVMEDRMATILRKHKYAIDDHTSDIKWARERINGLKVINKEVVSLGHDVSRIDKAVAQLEKAAAAKRYGDIDFNVLMQHVSTLAGRIEHVENQLTRIKDVL